jgi:hypothetical protein
MPPQRKKVKTYTEPDNSHIELTDPALHPDLAAQSSPLKMDPAVLHPDLAAQSTQLEPTPQPTQFAMENPIQSAPAPPKQRKNAAAASAAAAAVAAQLQQEQQPEEAAVSIDAAAEFLRTIQERESQKNLLTLTAQQDPNVGVGADGGLATDLSALQNYSAMQSTQASYQGFPTAAQFNAMMDEYLNSLSPKKQAKALLTQQMYDDILTVLLTPTETKIGSAQFRFWAKKMFKLVSTQVAHIVIHENKPVAVKEQLYDVLVQCHGQANHGGRDKTAGQVFPVYSLLIVGS